MPRLSQWSRDLGLQHVEGAADPEVTGVTADSRAVRPGDVFVAIRGSSGDGADYLRQAVELGAAAVILDRDTEQRPLPAHTSVYRATRPRWALAQLARERFGSPDRELRLVAVTGTNGKTTVSWLAAQLLELRDEPCGCLGTIRYRTGLRDEAARWTTPPPELFFSLLREMRAAGLGAAVFEASSHALDQDRIGACEVDVAAFTNLTREHLEYHRDLQDYLRAKLRLLERLGGASRVKPGGLAVIQMDDPTFAALSWPADSVLVGRSEGMHIRLLASQLSREGIRLELDYAGQRTLVESSLLGDYNVENLVLLAGVAHALQISAEEVARCFPRLHSVPGRLERLELGERAPLVLIDYAHTPDALQSVANSLSQLTAGRLRIVFGCGGDRDRGKRPEMARAALAGSDAAYLTLDNPRTEDPAQIFADAVAGFGGERERAFVIEDREEALRTALLACDREDTLLVAGKGHETYQILGEERVPWDDREVLRMIWREAGGRSSR